MKNTKVMTSTRRIEDDPEARHQRAHASSRRRRDTDADVSTAAQSSSTPAPGPSYSMAQVSPQRTAYQGDPSSTESSEDYSAEEDAPHVDVDVQPEQQGPEVEAAEQADQGGPLEVGIQREPPFPGGPEDLSLLWSYADHKAPWTWRALLEPEGRHAERQVVSMRVSTVGGKAWHLDFLGADAGQTAVRQLLQQTGLYDLPWCGYQEADSPLVLAFVERWHEETSSFHMPFGEMTITLDDVSALLHLPMGSRFYTPAPMDRDGAAAICVELLGGHFGAYKMEFDSLRCQAIRFATLKTLYDAALEGMF